MLNGNSAKVIEQTEITPQSNFVSVDDDGNCIWEPRYELGVTQCTVDVTWFPFDKQKCDLIFESWILSHNRFRLITNYNEEHNDAALVNYDETDNWSLTSM